jgi:hypothetical protein|tara:strand:+ start:7797 stop:11087 length:3291 start_codon:yes stop_codon:yes gene_type:complete
MTNANFRVKNGLYVVEDSSSSGNLTLLDGEIKSDGDLTVFPSATSGTNTAGNDMIVQGGAGTGSGAGGAIKFNVAGAGGSGSSANAQATKMQIASTGIVTMTDGTNASSTTTGTLIVTGGVGISANLYADVARFTGSTASSSTTTGALVVTGGAGIGGDLYVGDDLRLASDSALLTFGANDDVLLTHVADVGLQLSTTATSGANPVFEIYQDNADANGGVLRFKKEAGSSNTADNDKLGLIQFFGDDSGGTSTNMGQIEGRIADASNADELGRLMLRPRADSGSAGGVIIDGFTIEGILNQKHALKASIGGNHTSDSGYTLTESSSGSVINMFQYPSDNTDNSSQHYNASGGGSQIIYDVVPVLNIGGGSTPHVFKGTGQGSSESNYYPNLMVNGTGYSEARVKQVTAQGESNVHAGLGAAMVIETVDKHNFNGIYFTKDSANSTAFSWNTSDPSSTLGSDETWGVGKEVGQDGYFQIGYYADGYDDVAISTTKNPLRSANRLMSIHYAGGVGVDGVQGNVSSGLTVSVSTQTYSSSTSRSQNIQLNASGGLGPLGVYVNNGGGYSSGSTSAITVDDNSGGSPTLTGITSGKKLYDSSGNLVGTVSSASSTTINFSGNITHGLADNEQLYGMLGGVVYFEPSQASPASTAGRLYSYNGSLYWNGSDLTASAASALGDLSDVSYSSGDLSITSLDTFTMSASDTVMKIIDTSASGTASGGKLTLGSDDGAVMADNHRLGVIDFVGAEDTSNTQSVGARIQAVCRDAWNGSNNDADLEFYTVDGTTVSKVLTLDADKLASFEGDVTIAGNDLTFGNGATIVNTSSSVLTITEATTIFSGDIRVNGNDIKASDGTTAITLSGADVTVAGNLTVSGTTVQQDVATVTVEDPLIELARSNSADTIDIGFIGKYNDGSNDLYAGLFRDANDSGIFKLFKDTQEDLSAATAVNASATGFAFATLELATLDATTLSINTSGTQDAIVTSGSVALANIADTAGATTIDTFDCSVYQATKYLVLVEDITNNNFLSTEILVLGDDSPSNSAGYLTQYAVLYNDTELGTFSVTGTTSGNNINLQYDPTDISGSNNHKVRVVATRIASI